MACNFGLVPSLHRVTELGPRGQVKVSTLQGHAWRTSGHHLSSSVMGVAPVTTMPHHPGERPFAFVLPCAREYCTCIRLGILLRVFIRQ